MANDQNLIQNSNRSRDEVEEIRKKGGKKSGETRRKQADFRKALNAILTAEIDNPEWAPVLEAMGLDCTVESAVNAAMVKKAMAGNVSAYRAIRDTVGQTTKSDEDLREQQAKIRAMELANEEKEKAMSGSGKSGMGDFIKSAYMARKAQQEGENAE